MKRKVGDFCEFVYGKALPKEMRLSEPGIPAYGANGIKTYAMEALYEKRSIIVGRKGSAGELNMVNEPFWALDVCYYVVHDDKLANLDYVFFLLKSLNLPSLARGVKPGINRNDVYEIEVNLPSLDEQKLISEKLAVNLQIISSVKSRIEQQLIQLSSFEERYMKAAVR